MEKGKEAGEENNGASWLEEVVAELQEGQRESGSYWSPSERGTNSVLTAPLTIAEAS